MILSLLLYCRYKKFQSVPFFIPSENGIAEIPENIIEFEGLEQEECAEKMGISRPAFQRILLAARESNPDRGRQFYPEYLFCALS